MKCKNFFLSGCAIIAPGSGQSSKKETGRVTQPAPCAGSMMEQHIYLQDACTTVSLECLFRDLCSWAVGYEIRSLLTPAEFLTIQQQWPGLHPESRQRLELVGHTIHVGISHTWPERNARISRQPGKTPQLPVVAFVSFLLKNFVAISSKRGDNRGYAFRPRKNAGNLKVTSASSKQAGLRPTLRAGQDAIQLRRSPLVRRRTRNVKPIAQGGRKSPTP